MRSPDLNLLSSSPTFAAFAACSGSGVRRSGELFSMAGGTGTTLRCLSDPKPCALKDKPGLQREIKWEPALSYGTSVIEQTVVGLYSHPGFVCTTPIPRYFLYVLGIDPPVPALLIEYGAFFGKYPTG